METLHSAFGYVALLAMAWLLGRRTGTPPWRTIAVASALQVGLAALLLLTGLRLHVFGAVGALTELLKSTSQKAGESLLFIGVSNPEFSSTYGPIIALEIASVIIFVASLSRILYHYRVLPWLIGRLSGAMQRLMGISGAESVAVAANVLLGMTEAPLLVRPYVQRLTDSELFCMMVAGMATIAGTVMVVYASMLAGAHPEIAGHLFTASLISAPAAIAVAKLMLPETQTPATAGQPIELPSDDTLNGLDAAARGATEGMQLFINILAILIAFIGLVALANSTIAWIDTQVHSGVAVGWTLQAIAGWIFRLPVWLMGITWSEAGTVGSLMGIKTVLNEFVAYVELSNLMSQQPAPLSPRSFLICTYAMCGFANFGSVAIMIGGIGGIAPQRRGDLARLGFRSIVAGTLATMLTGCIVGLFV
jgi:CNT family concentrative nucleoside transporter